MRPATRTYLEGNVSKYHLKDVGIVVIGRNEGERLIRALAAAKSLCEHVVYTDSASTDGSVERARDLGVTIVSLDASLPLTAARGRKAGFERLIEENPQCRFVQFVDGDCILHPNWLAAARLFLESTPDAAVVCGRRSEAFPSASLYNRLIDEEWATRVGEADACGGDSMMRVEALRSVGSFRADLRAGEEPELCARLRGRGWKIWRLDSAMTEHDAAIHRFSQWWRRAERGGFGYAQVWSATKELPSRLYGRQMASALFWAIVVPVVLIGTTVAVGRLWPIILLLVGYGAQTCRIMMKRNRNTKLGYRSKAAALIMLVKFAEAKGVLRYWLGLRDGMRSYRDTLSIDPS